MYVALVSMAPMGVVRHVPVLAQDAAASQPAHHASKRCSLLMGSVLRTVQTECGTKMVSAAIAMNNVRRVKTLKAV